MYLLNICTCSFLFHSVVSNLGTMLLTGKVDVSWPLHPIIKLKDTGRADLQPAVQEQDVENKPRTLTLNKGLVQSRAVGCCYPPPTRGHDFSLFPSWGGGRGGCGQRPGVDRLLKTPGGGQRMHCGMWEIVSERWTPKSDECLVGMCTG